MIKLLKYLKPFLGGIFLVFILLFAQAMTDLALPDYTSRIVNEGIQQGGVENSAPDVIRASQLEKLTKIMTEEEQKVVNDHYKLLKKTDENLLDYPRLKDEDIYQLGEVSEEQLADLNRAFGEAYYTAYLVKTAGDKIEPTNGEIVIDPAKAKKSVEQMDEKISTLSDTALKQITVPFVQEEYKAIGIDTEQYQFNYMYRVGGLMILVTLIGGLCAIAVSYISARIGAGFAKNIRGMIFRKVESFSSVEFDKFSTASLITRTTNDVQQIQMLVIMVLRIVFYAPIMAIGGIYKVVNTDSSMSWITALAIGALLALIVGVFSVAMPKFKMVQKLIDKLNLVSREGLSGMMVVRAFNTQDHEEERFDKANRDLTKTNLFINRVTQLMMPVMMLIMNGSTLLIIWVGSHHVDQGTMQVGSLMAFMQYTIQIIFAFLMVSIMFIMIPRASVSAKRISEVLETKLTIVDLDKTEQFSESIKGELVFDNVNFKYPGAEDYVLKNISFKAHKGETTAIIGSTGAGKSTLINLIPRLYDITSGKILIDGTDISQVDQGTLRDKIGYVPQKTVLFSGTIESNFTFANENLTPEEIAKATEIAQAKDFIAGKEDGLQASISQGGSNVSGGQKQRLSIARALMKDAEFYIFDDSFSALDFKTDASLRQALHTHVNDATILLVAQRVSTIMQADQIIVLDEGEIVGIGKHAYLLENCPVYKDIAESQLSKEELGNE